MVNRFLEVAAKRVPGRSLARCRLPPFANRVLDLLRSLKRSRGPAAPRSTTSIYQVLRTPGACKFEDKSAVAMNAQVTKILAFARPTPLDYTRFSLVPDASDDKAYQRSLAVLLHPQNQRLVSVIPDDRNAGLQVVVGLNVGSSIQSNTESTLATLGRNGDIVIDGGPTISHIQCGFEIETSTNNVVLYDRSTSQTTQVFGDPTMSFEQGRVPHRILVKPRLNEAFGFGNVECRHFQFRISWHEIPMIPRPTSVLADLPWLARTLDEVPTAGISQWVTRIHTPIRAHKFR